MSVLEEIPYCDIFYPSWEEFADFSSYVEKCTKSAKSGIFKVIPPKGYIARKSGYKNLTLTVPHPIEQIVSGSAGFYEVLLLQKESKPFNKFAKLVEPFDKLSDNKKPSEVEKLFWKSLKFSSPLYGADAPGSLFDPGANWNLTEIDSVLKQGLDIKGIMGVTNPYLYFGAWKAMFCWHKEDLDLYSINYLHFGKPKFWYGIPTNEGHKFDKLARNHFPEAFKECSEFVRHKTYLISPEIIKENKIKVHKCLQQPGEFVITIGGSYHAGFNFGLNCAEAVNFALEDWIDLGKKAGVCKCKADNVKIDMEAFVNNLKNRRNPANDIFVSKQDKKSDEKKNKLINKKRERVNYAKSDHQEESIIDNWLRCDKCNKWRKLMKNQHPDKFKRGFECVNLKGTTCKTKEENWKDKYTVVNDHKSEKSKEINSSNKAVKLKNNKLKNNNNIEVNGKTKAIKKKFIGSKNQV